MVSVMQEMEVAWGFESGLGLGLGLRLGLGLVSSKGYGKSDEGD